MSAEESDPQMVCREPFTRVVYKKDGLLIIQKQNDEEGYVNVTIPVEFIPKFLQVIEQERLKPCPFCGSTEVEVCKTGVFWVRCALCGAEAPSSKRRPKALDLWNNRPVSDGFSIIVE